jgi:hypothetical protein
MARLLSQIGYVAGGAASGFRGGLEAGSLLNKINANKEAGISVKDFQEKFQQDWMARRDAQASLIGNRNPAAEAVDPNPLGAQPPTPMFTQPPGLEAQQPTEPTPFVTQKRVPRTLPSVYDWTLS